VVNGKPLLRRATRLVESGKGTAEVLSYDELSEHEGELPEYEYRFEVYIATTERLAWGLGLEPEESGMAALRAPSK
jgi:hypothetical protein